MQKLNNYIIEKLNLNKQFHVHKYRYFPTSNDELKNIINERIKKEGVTCDLNDIDISNISFLGWVFQGSKFNGDISLWDVSHIRNFYMMFIDSDFTGENSNLNLWDVSNAQEMGCMFADCPFNGDISDWNVSNVTNMGSMFFRNHHFDGDLSKWDVSNVEDFHSMFEHSAFTGKNGDISNWDVSNGQRFDEMFYYCSDFQCDLSKWDVKNATNMTRMFADCPVKKPKWYKPRRIH